MKKSVAAAVIFALMFSLVCASCEKSKSTYDDRSYEGVNTAVVETTESTTSVDRSDEPEYLAAREKFHKEVYEQKAEWNEEDQLQAYFVDLNGDGYKDIIYNAIWFPTLAVYQDGEFIQVDLNTEVCAGSLFPSGRNSGYFIDSENSVIIVRYGGHTQGTCLYNGAEAFKINGTTAESMWTLYADEDKFVPSDWENEEEVNAAADKCFEDFESKYRNKVEGYYLVDFFNICQSWTLD